MTLTTGEVIFAVVMGSCGGIIPAIVGYVIENRRERKPANDQSSSQDSR